MDLFEGCKDVAHYERDGFRDEEGGRRDPFAALYARNCARCRSQWRTRSHSSRFDRRGCVVINQDVKAFSCPERTLNEWLALFPRADAAQILAENRKDGTTVQSVGLDKLKALSFPVPPLTEQKRILAKVEGLLARSNAACERLARVPAILKRLRQAVLAAACKGGLTDANPEEWREATLEEVGEWFTGGTPSRRVASNFGGGIPWVKSGELRDGLVTETSETLSHTGVTSSAAKLMPKGTVSVVKRH